MDGAHTHVRLCINLHMRESEGHCYALSHVQCAFWVCSETQTLDCFHETPRSQGYEANLGNYIRNIFLSLVNSHGRIDDDDTVSSSFD